MLIPRWSDWARKHRVDPQQRLQPGDQISVNFAELIHNRVSDRKGSVLPGDLTYGTYDIKDLGSGHGSLSIGGMALDKTWGYRAVVPSPDCCGFGTPLIDPSAVDLSVGGVETVGVDAYDQCTNEEENVFSDITSWWSGNPAIATVSKGKVTGVSAGYTTANGSGEMLQCFGNTEYMEPIEPSAPVNVGPYQVEPTSTIAQGTFPAGECPTGGSNPGYLRAVNNQVQYADGTGYPYSVTAADVITVGARHDLGTGTSTGSAQTDSDGSFYDNYSICSTACPGSHRRNRRTAELDCRRKSFAPSQQRRLQMHLNHYRRALT